MWGAGGGLGGGQGGCERRIEVLVGGVRVDVNEELKCFCENSKKNIFFFGGGHGGGGGGRG